MALNPFFRLNYKFNKTILKYVIPFWDYDPNLRDNIISEIPIDIVIPTISKDFLILKRVIESARKYIRHPIINILIISNESMYIKEFCKENNCTFILEKEVLGYGKEKIAYSYDGKDRSGWLYQQLLKLAADKIAGCDNFLVLDSDTVFLRPHVFISKNKTLFAMSDEWHQPYFTVASRLLGFKAQSPLSFVSHHMLFKKEKLRNLRKLIEKNCETPWDDAIISATDKTSLSGFSEYETYGNFCLRYYPSETKQVYWFNTTDSSFLVKRSNFKTLSLHNYS